MKKRLFLAALAIGVLILPRGEGTAQELNYQIFGRYVEALAQQIGMPGLSAVIVHQNRVAWHQGYGYADVERQIRADRDTPYPIGGATQAITGVLTGICVDRFLLRVDTPIRSFVPGFPNDALVRHVLAHASTGRFVYDPAAFAALTTVVEGCFNRPFRLSTANEILNILGMTRSVPGMDLARAEGAGALALFEAPTVDRYQRILREVALPYRIRAGKYSPSEHPAYGLDAAGGLVASAQDLASFEGSLDDGRDNIPLGRGTLDQMWTQQVFDGAIKDTTYTTPTGLGWFVQFASGVKLVWTFGHIPDAGSALIVKMPSKELTLVMLSNSDGLTAGFNFERADVTTSPFVKVFLRLFI